MTPCKRGNRLRQERSHNKFESLYLSTPMRVASGTRLGPFEILAPLGAGGMGEVYRARDTRLDRTVAIKLLPSELVNAPGRRGGLPDSRVPNTAKGIENRSDCGRPTRRRFREQRVAHRHRDYGARGRSPHTAESAPHGTGRASNGPAVLRASSTRVNTPADPRTIRDAIVRSLTPVRLPVLNG